MAHSIKHLMSLYQKQLDANYELRLEVKRLKTKILAPSISIENNKILRISNKELIVKNAKLSECNHNLKNKVKLLKSLLKKLDSVV